MMQIGKNSGASTRKASTELAKTSRPASTMEARVLGEICNRVGSMSLQHKNVANDPLRASLPDFVFFLASQTAQ